jgi:hypothetical protein
MISTINDLNHRGNRGEKMNLKEMKQTDKNSNHLIHSSPAGPALDPSISKTEGPPIHPTFGREEDNHRLPLPEDGDFREYYRLR